MQLKLGQAFALACLIEYGPLLPAESSGHLDKRKALFRSAAWYSLSDEELDRVLQHKEVAPYLFSMVNQAKQYKYAISNKLDCISAIIFCALDDHIRIFQASLHGPASETYKMLTEIAQFVLA